MQKLLMQRFSNKAKCDLLKWLPMVVHVFHKNRSDLFSERKKTECKITTALYWLKRKSFTQVPNENHFLLKSVSVKTQRK